MTDEIRDHDPEPTDEERAWMETNPLRAIETVAIAVVLAFTIAGYVSYALDSGKPAVTALRHPG